MRKCITVGGLKLPQLTSTAGRRGAATARWHASLLIGNWLVLSCASVIYAAGQLDLPECAAQHILQLLASVTYCRQQLGKLFSLLMIIHCLSHIFY